MRYYLIAGEPSGDLHASRLMKALKVHDPQAEFRYFGGDLMAAEGGTLVKHIIKGTIFDALKLWIVIKYLQNDRDCRKSKEI